MGGVVDAVPVTLPSLSTSSCSTPSRPRSWALVHLLDPGAPDERALLHAAVLRQPDLGLADRPEVAEDVRGEGAAGVLAHGGEVRGHRREVLAVLLDLEHLAQGARVAGVVRGHRHRLVRRARPAAVGRAGRRAAGQPGAAGGDPLQQRLGSEADDGREPLEDRRAVLRLAQQQRPVDRHHQRGAVGDEQPALRVVDLPAGGRRDDGAGAVGARRLGVALARVDLQEPQPPEQREQDREHEDAQDEQAAAGLRAGRGEGHVHLRAGSGSTRRTSTPTSGTTNGVRTTA